MKRSCLEYLLCVECNKSHLTLSIIKEDDGEIIDGKLSCSCGTLYPIIRGVPRMLKKALLKGVLEHYGMDKENNNVKHHSQKTTVVQEKTMDAFGFEWTCYSDYDADNYYNWMPENFKPEEEFLNKVGLEVGCGAGRHAARTSQWADKHFAVDLSYAVDSAFEHTRHLPNCHVIQADAFDLPFAEGMFDYVYCLGVIQHMHNPPAGFTQLAKQPRKGGILLVNTYQASRPIVTGLLEILRKITIRMPAPLLNKFCYMAGVVDYGICSIWKGIEKSKLDKMLGPLVPGRVKEYSKHTFKTIVADWYDRLACPKKFHYTKEELAGWYENAGYINIRVTPYWKAFWNGYGLKA